MHITWRTPFSTLTAATALVLLFGAQGCDEDCLAHGGCEHAPADDVILDTVDVSDDAEALCQCLLLVCHDAFHATYGATDEEAIPACQTDARTLASSAIECRASACNASDCDAALGGGSCAAP